MEKKFTVWDAALLVLALVPLGYLLHIYDQLPASVPLHFGADGKPNRFGPKSELFATEGIVAGMSIAVYLLMKYLPSIDPKKQVQYGQQRFRQIGIGIIVFMAALNIFISTAAIDKTFKIDKVMVSLIGLLFVFLGNIIYNIKPNYFAGVRTPWTLEDPDTWRATHRLAGKVWVTGGIVATIAKLLLPAETGGQVFIACIVIMVLIPVVYSYIYFKKHQTKHNI